MNLNKVSIKTRYIFTVAIICLGFNFGILAQETNRTRIIPKKTPPKPAVTPTPTATPQTLSYLRSRINGVLSSALLKRGRVGVKIASLNSGKVVFERNADKYFMPASNMKSFTVASAIDKLTLDFRFTTSIYADSKPNTDGVIIGDLIVYGRGDPSISTSFNDGDYYKGIDALVSKIAAAGVKSIKGSIIGDETYFNAKPIPFGWEWDDLQWYYGAEISSLTINNNSVDLKILPGAIGAACVISVLPANRQFKIINRTQTTSSGTKREIKVTKRLGQNILEISERMPANDRGFQGAVTISRPAKLFVEILKQRLELKGIKVNGGTRAINLEERNGLRLKTDDLTEITNLKSPPLSLIAAKTMKPSQNLYTELILRALGEELGDKSDTKKTSAQRGIEIVHSVLRKAGVMPDSVIQYDASGLSRHNLITPNASVKLFTYMDKSRNAVVWRNALAIGGVDGTLKRRFIGTSAVGNVRGKTGTLDQVSALSGYVRSKTGERFVFSILTNNLPNSRLRSSTIDRIVVLLSNFDGKTN